MSGIHMSQAGLDDRIRDKGYQAVAGGADGMDLRLARDSGMDARDIMHLRGFTRHEGLLIVFRCPKRNAAAFHGDMPAKTWATKAKTNETGTVRSAQGILMVSDYDMMSMWRFTGTGYQKIFVSALQPGAASGPWGPEARRIVREMNGFLITKVQHGCQDDFVNREKNPGVKMVDHFLAIRTGDGVYLPDPIFCENFYRAHGLFWPYDTSGKHVGSAPG